MRGIFVPQNAYPATHSAVAKSPGISMLRHRNFRLRVSQAVAAPEPDGTAPAPPRSQPAPSRSQPSPGCSQFLPWRMCPAWTHSGVQAWPAHHPQRRRRQGPPQAACLGLDAGVSGGYGAFHRTGCQLQEWCYRTPYRLRYRFTVLGQYRFTLRFWR